MANEQKLNMTSLEFRPQQDFLLVKSVELNQEETTSGGIILMHDISVVDRPQTGMVISAGPLSENINSGDEVLFPQTDGIDFIFLDGKFSLYREKSIIGVCERDK